MLKILFNAKRAERNPKEFLIIGFFYASLSILVASLLFPEYASLIMIFFTSLSCLYVVQGAIKIEEARDTNPVEEKKLLRKHSKLVKLILFLFIGFVIAFAFWTFVLPENKVSEIFDIQENIVEGVQALKVTGNAFSNTQALEIILKNNFKVLIVSFILSLFYAAGSIFVIAWNASVMGFVIGSIAKNSENLLSIPVLFTKYFLHGIPEMLSYIIIILAGSILFIAFWKKDIFKQESKKRIIIDVLTLIAIAILLVIISAFIEVFISNLI